MIINIKENSYLNEKDYNLSIYKLATYYKYLIEIEKIDIIKALRNLLLNKNTKDGITMRAYYAIHRYNREITNLPYSECVKDKITSILNYVQVNIENFNLHMIFTGNPGTGKTSGKTYQKLLIEHAKNEEINNYKEDMYRIKEVDVQYEKLIADNLEKNWILGEYKYGTKKNN